MSILDRDRSIALVIGGFTLLRLLLVAILPLAPQEAYYWSWSRDLAWSYFDHPPLGTYSIALTTALFGQTAFAIQTAAVLWSIGWNLIWARLILDMFADRRLAFWSLVALNLTVLYEGCGIVMTPDAPMLFAWTGTIWAVWRASQSGDSRWWYAAGMFMGLAWLGKYSGVLLAPVVLLYLLFSPQQRHWLRTPHPYLALLVSAAMFAPVLIWNAQHEWVSFAFQGSQRISGMGGWKLHYFLVLLASQLALVTPYFFAVSIAAFVRGLRDWVAARADDRVRLLLFSGAVPLVLFTVVSFHTLVKMNWLAPAFWSLIILGMRGVLARERGGRWMGAGLASSAVFVALAVGVIAIPNVPLGGANTWSGWKEAAGRVERVAETLRAAGQKPFIFSPNYKVSSLLRFYLPGQPRTFAQDIFGEPALQFDYFPLERDLTGATGILVTDNLGESRFDRDRLHAYFDSVDLIDSLEIVGFGRVIRRVDIYRCSNYKGHPRRNDTRAGK